MNSVTNESGAWPSHRWWLLIALVFAAHVGLIFALGDRKPIVPLQPRYAPEFWLATGQSDLLALSDPTLFALPHPKGFAAAAWLRPSHVEFPPFRWTEPATIDAFPLPIAELGKTFLGFVQTNSSAQFDFETMPAPEVTLLETRLEMSPATSSVLRVAGELAERPMLKRIDLTNCPSADLLTNSTVKVMVDAAGMVFSATLQQPATASRSGDQQKADQGALDIAKAARFVPLPQSGNVYGNPLGRLTRGALIFEWRTVPLPATNSPAPNP